MTDALIERECQMLLQAMPELQHTILAQAHHQLSSASNIAPLGEVNGNTLTRNFPTAPTPLGRPPQPHAPSGPSPAHQQRARSAAAAVTTSLPLGITIDAFRLMNASPPLGATLVSGGGGPVEAALRAEVPSFLARRVREFLARTAGGGAAAANDDNGAPTQEPLSAWHPSLLDLVLRHQVTWDVRVLVLRVPHFFSYVAHHPELAEEAREAYESQSRQQTQNEADSMNLSALELSSIRASTQADACPSASPHAQARANFPSGSLSYPSDDFLESAPAATVAGVVHEIFYASRATTVAEPWMTLLVDRPSRPSGGGASASPLIVDLRLVTPSDASAALVLGQRVEVAGTLQVALCRPPEMRDGGRQGAARTTEYLAAHRVTVLLGDAAAGNCLDAQSVVASTAAAALDSEALATTPAPFMHETDACLSAEEEEWAAQLAVRCWEGLRLCLGTQPAPPPCVDGELACSELFHMSLDAVVAQLLVLSDAPVAAQDGGGLSLVLIGEDALVPGAYDRLVTAAPEALTRLHPCVTGHVQRSFFLPSYEVRRSVPGGGNSGNKENAGGGAGAAPRRASARSRGVPPFFPEVIRGGALTHASGRAVVLPRLEELPLESLLLLQDFFLSSPPIAGGAAAALSACGASQSGGGSSATTADHTARIVRRDGGQHVAYLAARSCIVGISSPAALRERPALFSFARRADVVLAPDYAVQRRLLALWGCTEERFQHLLRVRGAQWHRVLTAALAQPDGALLSGADAGSEARGRSRWLHAMPRLTEECGNILRTFFLAARALCPDAVTAAVMTTLVKLTTAHALLRARLAHAIAASGDPDAPPAAALTGPCTTALVDALVAVGLVDATLFMTTDKTLLGECIFVMLERECLAAAPPPTIASPGGDASLDEEERQLLRFVDELDWRTRWGPREALEARPHGFSVMDVVGDLIEHLNRGLSSAAAAAR